MSAVSRIQQGPLSSWMSELTEHVESVLSRTREPSGLPALPDDPEARRLGLAVSALVERSRQLSANSERLLSLHTRINTGVSLDDVMQRIYDDFHSEIPYQRIGLATIEAQGQVARSIWAHSDTGAYHLPIGYKARLQGSSLQVVMDSGEPRVLNDLPAYLARHPSSSSTALIIQEGFLSSLTCPLIAEGEAIGFLFFSSRERNAYTPEHTALLSEVAAQISLVLQKAQLIEKLTEANGRLEFANAELSRLATEDGLTGLANRRYFDTRLATEWRRAIREAQPLSLVILDVDFFKQYNDLYGHLAGDECLKSVAGALRRCLRRGGDVVCRFGGEEFGLLLPGVDPEGALTVGEKARAAVLGLDEEHAKSPNGKLTVSVGVATVTRETATVPEDLLERADHALYEAKRQGRNRVCGPKLASPSSGATTG